MRPTPLLLFLSSHNPQAYSRSLKQPSPQRMMKAAVTTQPGPPSVLQIQHDVPLPIPQTNQVRIRVKACGLNRSEMYTRQGHSPSVTFPRIQGIECVGIVDDCPSGKFQKGQPVAAIMGEMGRAYDGGYAEYTVVPERIVFAFRKSATLDWSVLGAVPEMYQTTQGSLDALQLEEGDTLLIRGGTSSIGLMAAQMAHTLGARVVATTRSPDKKDVLLANGVTDVLLDRPDLSVAVQELIPGGVDKVLELIGTKTLRDSLRCARPHGIVCMTGILGNEWIWKDFEPLRDIPNAVQLTSYGGGSENLSSESLQRFLDQVEANKIAIPVDRIYPLEDIVQAHERMEAGTGRGKMVIVMDPQEEENDGDTKEET